MFSTTFQNPVQRAEVLDFLTWSTLPSQHTIMEHYKLFCHFASNVTKDVTFDFFSQASACVRNDMTICNLDGVNPLDRNSWRTSVRRC